MKQSGFIIFIVLALVAYFGINFLVFSKIRQSLAGLGTLRTALLILFSLIVFAFPAGRFMESVLPNALGRICIVAGSVYLAFMVYAFLLILSAELAWWAGKLFHILPHWMTRNPQKCYRAATAIAGVVILATMLAGTINNCFPRIKTLNLAVDKPAVLSGEIRIVAASDLHLGILMNQPRLKKIINAINQLNPDLVLLAGDLVDEDAFHNSPSDLTGQLKSIRSKYGVYAVTGNHEYYAGLEKSAAFMKEGGVVLLQDSAVIVADRVCLIGRKDATARRMEGGRESLKQLADQCGFKLPVIVMDHQPFHLEEAEQSGIDLQISGHTHYGQLFPFNYITNAVYEKSWGYLKKGGTHYYISCGAGTWGPPIRTAGVPEIVNIRIKLNDAASSRVDDK